MIFAAGCGVNSASIASSPSHADLDCATDTSLIALPAVGDARIAYASDGASWLEISEAGSDAIVVDAVPGLFKVSVPTRYGRIFVPAQGRSSIRVRRIEPSNEAIQLPVRLHCGSVGDERVEWYRRAAAMSAELLPVPSGKPVAELLAQADALEKTAARPEMKALVIHLRAQVLYTANRTTEAALVFADAEEAWGIARDPARALVARTGQVEELIRAAEYDEALRLTEGLIEKNTYFSHRLATSRCQIRRYQGRLESAIACYEKRIAWLRAQREDAEAASMLLDQADAYRHLQKTQVAKQYAIEALGLAKGPYAALLRGRANLLLYDLCLDHADVSAAVGRIHGALDEFASMQASRWEANALMRAAWLYVQFGALHEAHVFLARARGLLSERDAPARVAAMWMIEADASRRAGEIHPALEAAHKAEQIFDRLGMSVELDDAQALVANLDLRAGDVRSANTLLDRHTSNPTAAWALLQARAAIERHDPSSAKHWLERTSSQRQLRLSQNIERVELESAWLARTGKREEAEANLRASAERVSGAADAVGNPLLGDMLRGHIAPLRSLAVELLLENAAADSNRSTDTASAAFAWLLALADTGRSVTRGPARPTLERFDREVARQLLAEEHVPHSDVDATRALLEMLADSPQKKEFVVARSSTPVSMDAFMARFGRDTVFVAYLDARTKGALLWITHEGARLVEAPAASELRAKTSSLMRAITLPTTPMREIDVAANELSAVLLASAPMSTAPKTLLVSGPELSGIPWAALRWKLDGEALVTSTNVSLVRLTRQCCATAGTQSGIIRLVASERVSRGTDDGLPPIGTSEERLIAAGIRGSKFRLEKNPVVIESGGILDALEGSGDWVHVVAHGSTAPSRVGYSGIWVDPAMPSSPAFMSGLDLLGHTARSELVVLNSCDLQRSAFLDAGPSPPNFADAVARAGAKNVVAALWQISDSAANVWVPAFYSAAASGAAPNFGAALRSAQIELRSSRRYRHPYYWASLVHTVTLDSVVARPDDQSNGSIAYWERHDEQVH